jgi:rhodanese-related sulfurtransferase
LMGSDPNDLLEQIRTGTPPLILDVRSEAEFRSGHVPGAVNIPFWQIVSQAENLKVHRDAPVVVYCGHGPRAYMAGAVLRRMGFSKVSYLKGHMYRWKSLGLSLEE